jgi:phosphoribosylaminoimidazolecarboxamide formyltransferase / IMP cyclohydrolase
MAINTVRTIDDRVRVRTVLASVSDKSGLETLVPGLIAACPGLSILSTGGTYDAIRMLLGARAAGVLRQVSEYTGQPEMQGGLVKTLDWRIYLGLLSETYNPVHRADMAMHNAVDIDVVVANLYPFSKTVARRGATSEDARGNIDIGGPCMVRAAAKNFHRVAVVTDPADYPGLLAELATGGGALSLTTRFELARKAFRATAQYDEAIAAYLADLDPAAMAAVYEVHRR